MYFNKNMVIKCTDIGYIRYIIVNHIDWLYSIIRVYVYRIVK